MTAIEIPRYGFSGLRDFQHLHPNDMHGADGRPFIHFHHLANQSHIGGGRPSVRRKECAQLENRGVLVSVIWQFGVGYNLTDAGLALLKAIRARPEGWPATMILLEDLLMNCDPFILAALCNMPCHFSSASKIGWFNLLEALEIVRQRRYSGVVEMANSGAVMDFFKQRPQMIPNEIMLEPSLNGRPSDQQIVLANHAYLNYLRRDYDLLTGGLTDADWDIA
jgi:hypothetical protein